MQCRSGSQLISCSYSVSAPRSPLRPAWFIEAMHDATSLGSTVVLATVVATISVYFFLTDRPGTAWLLLVAVLSGLALNNILKLSHARPRPPFAMDRFYTTSFPSGHAAMSAVTYLTIGISLAHA